jgi:hypothetical protein
MLLPALLYTGSGAGIRRITAITHVYYIKAENWDLDMPESPV